MLNALFLITPANKVCSGMSVVYFITASSCPYLPCSRFNLSPAPWSEFFFFGGIWLTLLLAALPFWKGAKDNFVGRGYNALTACLPHERGHQQSILPTYSRPIASRKALKYLWCKQIWFGSTFLLQKLFLRLIKLFQCQVKVSAHMQYLLMTSPALHVA